MDFKRSFSHGSFHSLPEVEKQGLGKVSRLPVSIRIILESLLRNLDGKRVREQDIRGLAAWQPKAERTEEIPFVVARVLLQDFTGVPLVVDLAAMRSAVERVKKPPKLIEPLVPVDLVVDHSVQVDFARVPNALQLNMRIEFTRNRARYEFLKWGMSAFDGLKIVPPGIGIVHQVLEVDLVHAPDPWRDDLQSVEGAHSPFEEFVPGAIARELDAHVELERIGHSREVNLDRVIDHQIDRHQGLDQLGRLVELADRAAHRREIHHQRDAGEVLQEHARHHERDLLGPLRLRLPRRQGPDVLLAHPFAVEVAQQRFEDDADTDREPRYLAEALLLDFRQRMERSVTEASLEVHGGRSYRAFDR